MKRVLTIAGHDLTSGAGITKDLEIFFGLGLHALSIPTSFVIQGPHGVRSVAPTPARPLAAMLKTVTEEIDLDGIKVGVLSDARQVKKIAPFLRKYHEKPIALDPVTRSKNGQALLSPDGLKHCVEEIFPLVFLLTPNLDEASQLTGEKIANLKEMKQAAKMLLAMGPKYVLLKGGHLPESQSTSCTTARSLSHTERCDSERGGTVPDALFRHSCSPSSCLAILWGRPFLRLRK
jgi:hydroxymethylpyrimidine/phosphomethylpyrimidine kinase